jgi:hypothetical protein
MLVTAAQVARTLNLSPSRVSQLRFSLNCPVIETAAGDRYDLQVVVPWYLARFGKSSVNTEAEMSADDDHAVALQRMTKIMHRAIQEHIESLTTDRGLTRFIEILQALGVDDRTQYLARRTVQLWMGTSLPGGEASVMMENPSEDLPVQWEAEWRNGVGRAIRGDAHR